MVSAVESLPVEVVGVGFGSPLPPVVGGAAVAALALLPAAEPLPVVGGCSSTMRLRANKTRATKSVSAGNQ